MSREHFYPLRCNNTWLGDSTYAKILKRQENVGVFALPCTMLTTTSSVYPAGPISNNLSSEEPNCFHYYSMRPFTAHFMNCSYWRVRKYSIGFLCSVAALFIQLCNDNWTEVQSIVQIFTVMNGYGYRFTSCGSPNSCHHGCLWLLSRLYHGSIWRLQVWEMKSSELVVCLSPRCFLIDYFLWIYRP